MSELIGVGASVGIESAKAIGGKIIGKKQKEKDEIERSRVFVDIEPITGLSPKLEGFYPNQVKKIYMCDEDRMPRSETASSMVLKITNPSDEVIRNVEVSIYVLNNYQGEKRTLRAHIPNITKGEWAIVLLPSTFTCCPSGAFIAGQIGQKHVEVIEKIRYVEAEYTSSKNEKLKVEANSNGMTRYYVNGTVLTSFENKGSYSFGI